MGVRRMSSRQIRDMQDLAEGDRPLVGGKASALGQLARLPGVAVPPGFCVTAEALAETLVRTSSATEAVTRLASLDPEDRESIARLSAQVRRSIAACVLPGELAAAVESALDRLGAQVPCAVRSSATAEDLPQASFAGQQESYLNVVGLSAVLRHIRLCWASVFSERAVTYRLRRGFARHDLGMAVIVQRLLMPQAAGVLFTADPATSNRHVACVEATFGLGEALAAGRVQPDSYRVRDGAVIGKAIALKALAVQAAPGGGTRSAEIEVARQREPALSDAQVVRLCALGRRIEAHFGQPQDIEWCLLEDGFQIVQSRPITTLFPLPVAEDASHRVYISVGHQQMMTEAMKPLGLSVWQRTTPRPMCEVGGRLFVDVTRTLGAPATRAGLLELARSSDPLLADALQTLLDRGDFIPPVADGSAPAAAGSVAADPLLVDPQLPAQLIARGQASLAALRRDIAPHSGPALMAFIAADIAELQRILFDAQSLQVITAAMAAGRWLNERGEAWLGERNVVDALAQSVPNSVTAEMGLALLDVADALRPWPEVLAVLRRGGEEGLLGRLSQVPGGSLARQAIQGFLDQYGMRCPGEIDITRPRWSERPDLLLPALLGNISGVEPGDGRRRFERGRRTAERKAEELLAAAAALPDGSRLAERAGALIDRLRAFSGYREYPKYHMVSRYFIYKQALLREAGRLVAAGALTADDDIFYLRFEELQAAAEGQAVDPTLVRQRREAFRLYQLLQPPRVFTSEGEVLAGTYRRGSVPPGALLGLGVSGGIVSGRARIVRDMARADLAAGDILVTPCADPGWTPLFPVIGGLVTEVGGLMTHGAVVAREYGLPTVVGVEQATTKIADGQLIRIHGTEGYVEILPEDGGRSMV